MGYPDGYILCSLFAYAFSRVRHSVASAWPCFDISAVFGEVKISLGSSLNFGVLDVAYDLLGNSLNLLLGHS